MGNRLTSGQKGALARLSNRFIASKDAHVVYLRKPLNNPSLSLVGYCFSLSALAYVLPDKPDVIYLVTPVSPAKVNSYDHGTKVPSFAPEKTHEFPKLFDRIMSFPFFCHPVSVKFLEVSISKLEIGDV